MFSDLAILTVFTYYLLKYLKILYIMTFFVNKYSKKI